THTYCQSQHSMHYIDASSLLTHVPVRPHRSPTHTIYTRPPITLPPDVHIRYAASGVLRGGLELSAKQWDWVLATNARPLLLLAQEAARLMPAGGRIVALSSLGSQRVIPGYVAIGASKAALEALTRYLAVELGAQEIT